MTKYILNEIETEILRLMKNCAVSDEDAIKCEITKAEIAKKLGISDEILSDILNILEENFIIMSRDDGYYNISYSAYDGIDGDFNVPEPEELTEDEIHEPDSEDTENVYDEQHIDFADLRADNPYNDDITADPDIEDNVSAILNTGQNKDKAREKGIKRMEDALLLSEQQINDVKNDKSGLQIENAYADEHLDYADIRGGDISVVNKNLSEELLFNSYEYAEKGEAAAKKVANAENIKKLIQTGILSPNIENIGKVTGDSVIPVNSVIADNTGKIKVSVNDEVTIHDGIVIKPDADAYRFNSYEEKTVNNLTIHNNSNDIASNTDEAIKNIYKMGFSTNTAYDSNNSAAKIIADAINESGSEDAYKGQQNRYEFDPVKTIVNTDSDKKNNTENTIIIGDAAKNNPNITEKLKITNFSEITAMNALNKVSSTYDTVFNRQGYLDSNAMELSGLALFSVAVSSANALSKASIRFEESALKTYEKIKTINSLKSFDLTALNNDTKPEMMKALIDEGISRAEASNLFKHKDSIINEQAFRNEVKLQLKTNRAFLSSNRELREYLEKKGFKNLSGISQLKIIDELNKYNSNAAVRNISFSELKTSQFKKNGAVFKSSDSNDKFSRMLFTKAVRAGRKRDLEKFTARYGMRAALREFICRADFGRQDLAFSTLKKGINSERANKNKARLVIFGTKTAIQFIKHTEGFVKKTLGYASERINKDKQLKRIESNIKKRRVITGSKKASRKEFIRAVTAAKAGSNDDKDKYSTIKRSADKNDKDRTRAEVLHRVVSADGSLNRAKKAVNNVSTVMKNAKNSGFKKASGKEAAKTAVNTAKTAKKTAEAVKEGSRITRLVQGISKLIASVPIPVWLVIAIIIVIFIILHIIMDVNSSMVGYFNSVIKDGQEVSKEFADGIGKALIDPIREMHESVILVNDKPNTFSDRYMDITEYLETIQELDEKREENAIKFAKAKLFTYIPEEMGLSNRQINDRNGQNADILAGKKTEYYGSLDKKNPYTLHYMDAYGNEIANHSTNAKDILSLCAVMYGNAYDRSHAFKILVEDEWYLMNPEIKWQESDIYCCEQNNCEVIGDTAYYTLCGDKYDANGSLDYYYCNKSEEVSQIRQYIDSGAKVTGEIVDYSSNGCKVRILDKYMRIPVDKRYFEGSGVTFTQGNYDLYDAYVDGWISYDDYIDIWRDCDNDGSLDVSYMDGTFFKEEHYCPGHYAACCFGHKDIDIYITLYDKEYAYLHNLYPDEATSHTGQYSRYSEYFDDFLLDNGFFNNGNCRWADKLYDNDWYDLYGVDILGGVGFQIGGGLSNADIDRILEGLSEQDITIRQQAIIEFALQYVGRIPYYWGGKAETLDYEGNHFYSIVEADYKGRTRKGLDCSGFVQWVMANNGIRVPGSTAGYSAYQTTRDHSTLKIGDLGLANPPGSKSNHIGIYAGVDENGNDVWIHCNSSAGNVSVNNYNGFRYYISL